MQQSRKGNTVSTSKMNNFISSQMCERIGSGGLIGSLDLIITKKNKKLYFLKIITFPTNEKPQWDNKIYIRVHQKTLFHLLWFLVEIRLMWSICGEVKARR